LRSSAGIVIGTFSIIDTEPRDFPDEDRTRLQEAADDLMAEIAQQHAKAAEANGSATLVIEG
jgi:hypothetical protein